MGVRPTSPRCPCCGRRASEHPIQKKESKPAPIAEWIFGITSVYAIGTAIVYEVFDQPMWATLLSVPAGVVVIAATILMLQIAGG